VPGTRKRADRLTIAGVWNAKRTGRLAIADGVWNAEAHRQAAACWFCLSARNAEAHRQGGSMPTNRVSGDTIAGFAWPPGTRKRTDRLLIVSSARNAKRTDRLVMACSARNAEAHRQAADCQFCTERGSAPAGEKRSDTTTAAGARCAAQRIAVSRAAGRRVKRDSLRHARPLPGKLRAADPKRRQRTAIRRRVSQPCGNVGAGARP
jgi:hypothetical protein